MAAFLGCLCASVPLWLAPLLNPCVPSIPWFKCSLSPAPRLFPQLRASVSMFKFPRYRFPTFPQIRGDPSPSVVNPLFKKFAVALTLALTR
jgi:hypothetical protein